MKKYALYTVIGLVLAAALIIFVLPGGIGFLVKDRYLTMLNTVNKSGNLELRITKYHRGWFNSEATLEVKPSGSALIHLQDWSEGSNAKPITFLIDQTIQHGPILKLITAEGKTRWLFGQALLKSQTQPSIGAINSITLIRIGGSLLSAVTAPVIHYSNPEKHMLLIMKGLAMSLNLSADFNHINTRFNIPQLDLKTADFQQSISGFAAQYNLQKSPSGLMWGEKITAINDITWKTTKDNSQANIAGLYVDMRSSEARNKVTYAINATLNNLSIADQQYGPQQLDLVLNKLDLTTVLALTSALKKLRQVNSMPPEQLQTYSNLFAQLIRNGMEINIRKLSLNTHWGAPQLTAQLIWSPQPTDEPNQGLNLTQLNADAHLTLPARFLTQALNYTYQYLVKNKLLTPNPQNLSKLNSNPDYIAQEIISWWAQNRWITAQDGSYSLDVGYKKQAITVNGQALQGRSVFPSTIQQSSDSTTAANSKSGKSGSGGSDPKNPDVHTAGKVPKSGKK